MQGVKKWLLAALIVSVLGGTVIVIEMATSRTVVAVEKGPDDHWRFYDGHWSYWHGGDNRWYYTDGLHWYYRSPTGWVLYQFDKLFGRAGFHHGEYKVPTDRAKIEVPRHDVFVHR